MDNTDEPGLSAEEKALLKARREKVQAQADEWVERLCRMEELAQVCRERRDECLDRLREIDLALERDPPRVPTKAVREAHPDWRGRRDAHLLWRCPNCRREERSGNPGVKRCEDCGFKVRLCRPEPPVLRTP